MKKYITIAALLAAGTTFANAALETTEYSLFSSADGWTMNYLEKNWGSDVNKPSINTTEEEFYAQTANWKRPVGKYTFEEALVLDSKEESISFSFDISNVVKNAVGTVAFCGTKGSAAYSVVAGMTYRGTNGANVKNFLSGECNNNSADAYLLGSDNGWGGNTWNLPYNGLKELGAIGSSASFAGIIEWQEASSSFVMTLSQGVSSTTYDLGEKYTLSGITIALDGQTGSSPIISNLDITYVAAIPEPSAFGLLAGLGALALVASRRRRK